MTCLCTKASPDLLRNRAKTFSGTLLNLTQRLLEGSGEGLGGFGAEPGQVQQVPKKVWEALVQPQIRFNTVPEKVLEGLGVFGAEPGQAQQGSGDSGEGFPEKVPEKVEGSGSGKGSGFRRRFQEALVQSQVRFNRVPEKVPEKVPEQVGEALVQSQVRFNRVPEKVPEKV